MKNLVGTSLLLLTLLVNWRPLLSTVTACAWSGKDGVQHWNYEGEPIPDHSRDGRQLIFLSYDGACSADDHQAFGSAPWGSGSYRYRIGAVDVAGNEVKSDEIAVPTAR